MHTNHNFTPIRAKSFRLSHKLKNAIHNKTKRKLMSIINSKNLTKKKIKTKSAKKSFAL